MSQNSQEGPKQDLPLVCVPGECHGPNFHVEIARLRAERDEALIREASLADLLNSWARESGVEEGQKQEDAKAVADRLWVYWSGEYHKTLARIRTLEATLNDIPCSGPTGCEALAQVAVLLKTLQHIIQYGCERDADYCQIEASKAHAEARALLDRLQRAEAVVTEMKQLLCEAAYLIQFQHDSDAAAQGWTDRYREEKAAWDAGKETT